MCTIKKCCCLFLLALSISSCKKDKTDSAEYQETIKSVVSKTIGTYNTTSICTSGSGIGGYVTDTFYNVQLQVASLSDTTLYINSRELFFAGNLSDKDYYFYSASSGGGYHARIDSTFTNLLFGYWDGGLGGGGGCSQTGTR